MTYEQEAELLKSLDWDPCYYRHEDKNGTIELIPYFLSPIDERVLARSSNQTNATWVLLDGKRSTDYVINSGEGGWDARGTLSYCLGTLEEIYQKHVDATKKISLVLFRADFEEKEKFYATP